MRAKAIELDNVANIDRQLHSMETAGFIAIWHSVLPQRPTS